MSTSITFLFASPLLLQTDTIFLSALNFADEPAPTMSGMRNDDEEEDNDNDDDKCKDQDEIECSKVSLPFLFICLLNISADLTSNFSACLCRGRG